MVILPASWQGWLVVAICVALFFIFKLGDIESEGSPKMIILILMIVGLIFIIHKKITT